MTDTAGHVKRPEPEVAPVPDPPKPATERNRGGDRGGQQQQEAESIAALLVAQITGRRGGARGLDPEDLAAERAPGPEFVGNTVGKRATAEAQTVSADPMIDRIKLGEAIATKGRLGAEGLTSLMAGAGSRGPVMTPMTGGTPLLDQHRQAREGLEQGVRDEVERQRQAALAKEEAANRVAGLQAMIEEMRPNVKAVRDIAPWDVTAIGTLAKTASDAAKAVTTPAPTDLAQVELRDTAAKAALEALSQRIAEDAAWMDALRPYDMATITEGLEKHAANDKTLMTNSMEQTWRQIATLGAALPRDSDKVAAYVTTLSKDVDRKTPFDAEIAKGKLTGGTPAKKTELITILQAKTKIKRSISEILAQETNTMVLLGLVGKFDTLDGFGYVLEKTTDRDKLKSIADVSNRNLPALKRAYVAAGGAVGTVEQWLLTTARHKIATLDSWLSRNGKAWAGQAGAAPAFVPPPGTATITKEQIMAVAVPREGNSWPASGGYAGNRRYGNDKGPPDMLLPTLTATGEAITYTEYDIKPYTPGVNRGTSRFLKGSDGRFYATNDHYKSFRQF